MGTDRWSEFNARLLAEDRRPGKAVSGRKPRAAGGAGSVPGLPLQSSSPARNGQLQAFERANPPARLPPTQTASVHKDPPPRPAEGTLLCPVPAASSVWAWASRECSPAVRASGLPGARHRREARQGHVLLRAASHRATAHLWAGVLGGRGRCAWLRASVGGRALALCGLWGRSRTFHGTALAGGSSDPCVSDSGVWAPPRTRPPGPLAAGARAWGVVVPVIWPFR